MGFDVYITRNEDPFEENGENISLDEWLNYVKNDSTMRLDNFAEAPIDGTDSYLRMENAGLSVWKDYSKNIEGGNMAWFNYQDGMISVKNPDIEILAKMLVIARILKAKVVPEEGEEITESMFDTDSEKQDLRIVSFSEKPDYSSDYFVAKTDDGFEQLKPNWSWIAFAKGPFNCEQTIPFWILSFILLVVVKLVSTEISYSAGLILSLCLWVSISLYFGFRYNALKIHKFMQEFEFWIIRTDSAFEAREIARKEFDRKQNSSQTNSII
jgi:hypothetical protein